MNATDYADVTREELLLQSAELILAVRLGKTATDQFVEKAERLASVFLAFDDWLARGGDLPRDWKRP
jgi:hypothetical protein